MPYGGFFCFKMPLLLTEENLCYQWIFGSYKLLNHIHPGNCVNRLGAPLKVLKGQVLSLVDKFGIVHVLVSFLPLWMKRNKSYSLCWRWLKVYASQMPNFLIVGLFSSEQFLGGKEQQILESKFSNIYDTILSGFLCYAVLLPQL